MLVDGLRDDDPVEVGQVVGQEPEVGGLTPVIELGQHAPAELFDHGSEPERFPGFGVPVGQSGHLGDRLEVLDDAAGDVGALDLDGDLAAVVQTGVVDLAEGRRSHRVGVEGGEPPLDRNPELLLHDGLHHLERERGTVLLEAGQCLDVGRRKQVGPGGEQLAELDEGRPEPFEISGERFGVGGHLVACLGAERTGWFAVPLVPDMTGGLAAAVLGQQPGDVAVAPNLLWPNRDRHGRSPLLRLAAVSVAGMYSAPE